MRDLKHIIRHIGMMGFGVALLAINSHPANADIAACDGKYNHAAELVDAAHGKYGTLYSGGHHQHRTDHVGATLDLYRLWRGWPDAGLRRAQVAGIGGGYDTGEHYLPSPEVAEVWGRAKWAAEAGDITGRSDQDLAFAAQGFDRLTGPTLGRDDWRRGELPEQITGGWPEAVALMAQEPALDWVQSVAVASHADYALSWYLEANMSKAVRAAHGRIAATDWARFRAGEGIEWAVSAALHTSRDDELEGLGDTITRWRKGVETCEASPQEYAALASAQVALGRFSEFAFREPRDETKTGMASLMPVHVQSVLFRHQFQRKLLGLPNRCTRDNDTPLAETARVEALMQRLYAACKIEHVPLRQVAYAFRAYNLLSADHLAELGRREGAPHGLVRAAFARHVALGNWQSAEDLLPDLMAASPYVAERIEREWEARRRPKRVRLARIILFTPNLGTMVGTYEDSEQGMRLHVNNVLGGADEGGSVTGTRNLLSGYLDDEIMQRDYEVMLGLPGRWGAFFGVRSGLGNSAIGRASRRLSRFGVYWRTPETSDEVRVPRIGRPGDWRGVPFVKNLTAQSELRQLSGDSALMHTVSDIIIDWSGQQTQGRWARRFGNHEADAEALAQLIELCRYNSCGMHAGRFQVQRAFELLKLRMGRTEAAKATKYWWLPDSRTR